MRVDLYVVKETNDLWRTLQEIATNEFFVVGFDKTDTLYYKRHPMFQTVLPNSVLTLTDAHIIGEPEVVFRDNDPIRQTRLHAVTDEGNTLHAYYPDVGSLPTQGKRLDITRIRCNDQNTLQYWANTRYAFETRDVTVRLTLPGYMGLLFEMLDRISVTYAGTARNGLAINWVAKKFWIHDITVNIDNTGSGTTQLTLEAESTA
jgi:hypothetical protein